MIDASHAWFRPLWRRVAVSAVAIAWGGFELVNGNAGWAMVFAALGVWALFLHRGAKARNTGKTIAEDEKDRP